MPTYRITSPDGKTLKITGDRPPNEQELQQMFAKVGSSPAPQPTPEPTPQPTLGFGERAREVARAAVPYARPALEVGGALAGAALAAPANVLAPGVASLGGAGLGYAAGRRVARGLETFAGTKPPETAGQAFLGAARDVPLGAAMEAGGTVIGLPVQKGLQAASKLAPRIYESIAKIAPRSIPKAQRERAVATAFQYGIPATTKGLKKSSDLINTLNKQIGDVLDTASQKGDTIKTSNILKRLDDVKTWAKKSYENPKPILDNIDIYAKEITEVRGEIIPAIEAQKLKQGIYKRLTDAAYGEIKGPDKEMSKAFARGIKEELVDKYPALQQLNAEDSALIGLNNILEKSVSRIRNRDILGLSEYGGTIGGAQLAGGGGAAIGLIASKILKSPAVMSRLSFALAKAGKKAGIPVAQRAIAYPAVGKAADQEDVTVPPMPELPEPGLNYFKDMAGIGPSVAQAETAPTMPQQLTAEQQATQAYLAGDYDTAIAGFKKAIAVNPGKAAQYRKALQQIMIEKQRTQQLGGR